MFGSGNCHHSYEKGEKQQIEASFELPTTTKDSDLCSIAVDTLSINEGNVGSSTNQMVSSGICSGHSSVHDSISTGGGGEELLYGYGDDRAEGHPMNGKMGHILSSMHCHCQPMPPHYGSSSTTFSSESSNLTNSSLTCTSEVRRFHADQESVASSSGVATMSSTDPLPMIDATGSVVHSPPLSRSSADDSTPTITTLSSGATRLRRELGSLLDDDAHLFASSGSVLSNTATSAFSTLSLNTPVSTSSLSTTHPTPTDLENKYNLAPVHNADRTSATMVRAKYDTEGLLASHCQAHSSPSLIGTGACGAFEWKKQSDPANFLSGCDGPFALAEKQHNQNSERPLENAEATSTSAAMTASGAVLMNAPTPVASVPSTSSALPGQLLPHFGPASVPLPSMFNCAATSCSQIICTPLRTIVSQNRRRYQMDGFNLDLTYITDRIIAMGYPADTREALYRNSMNHIVRFLEHYHPGHYKVFNLRGQYVYDPANFHNRVVSFEMTDHHPPRLELMAPFCREVHEYLEADPQNVVAVHCKAGKGRTGVMICAYLCYISFYRIPRQNMDYYSIIRTHNNKGVTIPSQRRYVYYFSHLRERKLNYMPLRCELVGVYLERPPKLSGAFSKGALKARVAVGDVDVFLGNELWLDCEKYEEEEELHKRFPLMAGEDQHDPTKFNPQNNCISRRCFGWTVPENRRVFLEGDIRVDIFQKSQLKLFNVKQEKKKIGHVWFNTMFTCPGFCGEAYVHGDEAYSYPEAMIVRRCYKRRIRQQRSERKQQQEHHETFSNDEKKDTNKEREKSVSTLARPGGLGLNGIAANASTASKKCSSRSPCRQLIEAESRSWQSQDGEEHQQKAYQHGCRSSLDVMAIMSTSGNNDSEWVDEIVVERPPGMDAHCPEEALKRIFPNEKQAPRHGIEEMIRDAFHKNLISDSYNTRRMSQAKIDGQPIPKAPIGRPNADGPFCLMRRPDEHVSVFGVQEIDRAYKNKDIDASFKLFIITRCIDESNEKNVLLAEQHIAATRQKQAQKDKEKSYKMEQKQRKLGPTSSSASVAQHQKQSISQLEFSNSALSDASCSSSSSLAVSSLSSAPSTSETAFKSHSLSFPDSTQFRPSADDPRLSDPHLRKFFFRQRLSSQSRHPHIHHHCSLRLPDSRICAKFSCIGSIDPTVSNSPREQLPTLDPHTMEEIDEGKGEMMDDSSLNEFDFFHPRQTTCSTIRDDRGETKTGKTEVDNNLSSSSSLNTITPMTQTTKTTLTCERGNQQENDPKKRPLNQESFSRKKCNSERSSLISSPSTDHTDLEIFHPSDCSLGPSSSSCSSSDSLENQQQSQHSSARDSKTPNIVQPQQSPHQHHSHRHRNHSSHKSGDSGSQGSRERK